MPDIQQPHSPDPDYELVPHNEIADLRDELRKLRNFPEGPSSRLQVGMDELNQKIERLTTIFEEASHQVKVEEGGLSFKAQLAPLMGKLNKVLEQNAEIASAIVALADLIHEKAGGEEKKEEEMPRPSLVPPMPGMNGPPPFPPRNPMMGPPPMGPPPMPGRGPPPPPPRR